MFTLSDAQLKDVKNEGLEPIVVADSYVTFATLSTLPKDKINLFLKIIESTYNFDTLNSAGYFADYAGFKEFLKKSEVYKAALLVGQSNSSIRKLVFETSFWLTSEIGESNPSITLAAWNELNVLSKGSIKSSISPSGISAWNEAIDRFKLNPLYKL